MTNTAADTAEPRPVSIVGSKSWIKELRKKAKRLAKQVDQVYMDLAECLYLVYDTPVGNDPESPAVYVYWGYTSVGEWAEKELDIPRRKADRLRRIWYRLQRELQIEKPLMRRIAALGISKTRELIRVVNEATVEEWVKLAEQVNYPEFYQRVQEYLDDVIMQQEAREEALEAGEEVDVSPVPVPDPQDEEEKLIPQTFQFYPEQAKVVVQALQCAAELSQSKKKGHNLSLICLDYLATNDFMEDMKDRQRYLKKIENSMRVKIIAIDPAQGEIVFGHRTLELMAKQELEDE
jgi:hypothetical protein